MRKLIVGAQVSLDGVMQAPGATLEDPTNGFPFGGWAMPYVDQIFGEEVDHMFSDPFDLLLGRKTYEIFAAFWPYQEPSAPHGHIKTLFDRIKKYPVTKRGELDTSWEGTEVLRDLDAVRRLKQEHGPNLVTQGSTELVHGLFAEDLVDVVSIITVPVVLGRGKRLWADGAAPHAFTLVRSRVSENGVMVGHYERAGDVKLGNTMTGEPSKREIARRARIKREG
jgi:dihydrofolate reductase